MESVTITASTGGQANPPRGFLLRLWLLAILFFIFFQSGTITQFRSGLVRGDAIQTFHSLLSRMAAGEEMTLFQFDNHQWSNHIMLVLFPWSWLYKIWDDPFVYLTPLNLALAGAVIPLGLLAWHKTRMETPSLAIAALYGLSHLTSSIRLSVHIESLVIPLWFILFLSLEKRHTIGFWLSILGLLLVKEDQPIWLSIFAVWGIAFHREYWKHLAALLIVSVISYLVFKGLMANAPRTTDGDIDDFWVARVRDGLDTPGQLLRAFFAAPLSFIIPAFFSKTWIPLLLSAGFLCLLGWRPLLMLIPAAFIFLAADWPIFANLLYYYGYPFLPPLFYALCEGTAFLLRRFGGWEKVPRILAVYLLLIALINFAIPTRVDGMRPTPPWVSGAERNRIDLVRFLIDQHIPNDGDYLVACHYDFAAYLPQGRQIRFLRADHLAYANAAIIDINRLSLDVAPRDYGEIVEPLAGDPQWEILDFLEGIMVLQRQKQ